MTTEAQTHWRMFCAIELPEELKARVAQYVERLRSEFLNLRVSWERTEKLHITLKFLGEIEVARIEELTLAAGRAAAAFSTFELTVAETGTFPRQGQPRALWLGIGGDTRRLLSLYQSLEDECAAAGFKRETRPFKPHLTLARIRSQQGARQLADAHLEAKFEPMAFKVSEIVVMRSELGRGGSRYEAVSRRPLSGGAT